jgi:hypothetical protein
MSNPVQHHFRESGLEAALRGLAGQWGGGRYCSRAFVRSFHCSLHAACEWVWILKRAVENDSDFLVTRRQGLDGLLCLWKGGSLLAWIFDRLRRN